MKVYFSKMWDVPCVCNPVIGWHMKHGWVWDVEQFDGIGIERIGVFYCTLLCGAGCVCHFESARRGLRPGVILAAMRKGIWLVRGCDVIYATIPEEKEKLIRCAIRLGFGIVEDGGYVSEGKAMKLLKYYGRRNARLSKEQRPTERVMRWDQVQAK